MTQITKTKADVQTTPRTTAIGNWFIRHGELLAPIFLVAAGVAILISNYLAIPGFTGLMAIGVGMASIISGGVLVEHWQRYAWMAVLMATGGAALCIMGLINQLQTAEFTAAAINGGVILLQMTGAMLTLYWLAQPNHSRL